MTSRTGNIFSDALTEHLTDVELQEMSDLSDYLKEKAGRGSTGHLHSSECSIGEMLNKASPAVRGAFKRMSDVAESPRELPFYPKRSEAEFFDKLGLDAEAGVVAKSALDGQHVMGELQSRMGTDSDREPEPISRREQVSAAFDSAVAQHSGE